MGYNKVIWAGEQVEIYKYEQDRKTGINRPRPGVSKGVNGVSGSAEDSSQLSCVDAVRQVDEVKSDNIEKKARIEGNAKRAQLAFRRLVLANISRTDAPVLASFTYRENMGQLSEGRADFGAFARNAKQVFGESFRYIVVAEFQKRGALHFHALLWGIEKTVVESERTTRMVAALWGKGFVDLIQTDGSAKLATYLSKYFVKMFMDIRLAGRKAYIASRNIKRPIVYKDALLSPFFYGVAGYPQLENAPVLTEFEYETQWLGRCHYKKYITVQYGKTNSDNA